MAHEYAIAFSIAGKLSGEFKKSFNIASKCMMDCNKTLQKLNSQMGQINNLIKHREATAKAAVGYRQAQNALREYINSQRSAGNVVDHNSKEYLKLAKNVDKSRIAYEKAKNTMREYAKQSEFGGMRMGGLVGKKEDIGGRIDRASKFEKIKGKFVENAVAFSVAGQQIQSFFGGVIRAGANFEHQMARVGAISRAVGNNLNVLTEAARQAGANTEWSASQAGKAEEILAQGGMSVNEIVKALIPTLNFATAAAVGLDDASNILIGTLRGWGMEAGESARVTNIIADATRRANINAIDFNESMKYVAPIAKQAGLSLEFATAVIAKMGDANIKGSQAGTAFRTVLLRMANKGRKAMNALGISVQDANGNFRNMDEIFRDLNERMKDMGNAEKMLNLQKIFGAEASSFAQILLNSTKNIDGGVVELADILKNSDSNKVAENMALQQSRTTIGQYNTMMSKWENFQIETFKKLQPVIGPVIDGLTKILGIVSEFMAENPGFAKTISVVAVALGGIVAIVGPIVLAFSILSTIGAAVAFVFGSIGGIGLVVAGAIALISTFVGLLIANFDELSSIALKCWNGLKDVALSAINAIIGGINRLIDGINSVMSFRVPDWIPGVGGRQLGLEIPKINAYANGGIVTSPELAMVGEGREPEAIIPLSKLESMIGGGTGGGMAVSFSPTIYVQGGGSDAYEQVRRGLSEGADDLKRQLMALQTQNRRVGYA